MVPSTKKPWKFHLIIGRIGKTHIQANCAELNGIGKILHYYITGLKNLDIASHGTGQQISTAGTLFEVQFIANSFSGVI